MFGDEPTKCRISGTEGTVSSVMSLAPRSCKVMVMLVCTAGKGRDRIDARIQPLDGNHGPSVMVLDNRFIPAARLCVEMIRRFLRRLSVWSMINPDLLWITGDATMCGDELTECRTLGTGGTVVFSNESHFTPFHSDGRAHVHCRQERPIDACIQPLGGNHGPSVMVWGAIHHYTKY